MNESKGEWDRKMESEMWCDARDENERVRKTRDENVKWKIYIEIEYYFITYFFFFGTFLKLNLLCAFNTIQSLIRNMNA